MMNKPTPENFTVRRFVKRIQNTPANTGTMIYENADPDAMFHVTVEDAALFQAAMVKEVRDADYIFELVYDVVTPGETDYMNGGFYCNGVFLGREPPGLSVTYTERGVVDLETMDITWRVLYFPGIAMEISFTTHKAVELTEGRRQVIARAGENNVMVAFRAKDWMEEYPDGTPQLMVTDPRGVKTPVFVEKDHEYIVGQVPEELLKAPGLYLYQFMMADGGTLVKARQCPALVMGGKTCPPPMKNGTPDWAEKIFTEVEAVRGAQQEAIGAGETAQQAAQAAAASATAAQQSAAEATEKARQAAASAEAAAEAVEQAAEQAQEDTQAQALAAAESARQAAASAQEAAEAAEALTPATLAEILSVLGIETRATVAYASTNGAKVFHNINIVDLNQFAEAVGGATGAYAFIYHPGDAKPWVMNHGPYYTTEEMCALYGLEVVEAFDQVVDPSTGQETSVADNPYDTFTVMLTIV